MNNEGESIVPERHRMKLSEFRMVSEYITGNYGIKLPEFKKTMVEGRLQKRLRELSFNDFASYLTYTFSDDGREELLSMIDAITTNKTDFFREEQHFTFMRNNILPDFSKSNGHEELRVWSAASSSGEEIYSIAIEIEEYKRTLTKGGVRYSILGTDLSVEELKKAKAAIYSNERIRDIPVELRKRYFLKSRDRERARVRVIPALRSHVSFERLNLMNADYDMKGQFHVIFCRNVLIYFDQQTQEDVINKLCRYLKPDGYFFLGHSESIIGKKVPLKQLMPTVYRKV